MVTGSGAAVADQATAASAQGAATGSPTASLLATLLAGNGKTEPKAAAGEAKASAGSSDKSAQNSTVDPTGLALMQSMVAPAMVPVSDKVTNTAASNSGSDRSSTSSQPDAIASLGQGGAKGKNLPNLMAGIAAQLTGKSAQAQSEGAGQSQSAGQNPTPSDTKFLDVLTAKVSNASAVVATLSTPDQSQVQAVSTLSTDTSAASLASAAVPSHSMGQIQPTASGTAGTSSMNMQNSFGSTGWTQELGDKMVWMAGKQGHTSELILNPPSLGTVEVRLHVNGTDAGAQFFSANADVRNAIEAAMPKLREMLAGAGIALGEAMVSNQSFSQREAFRQQSQKAGQGGGGGNGDDPVSGVSVGGASMAPLAAGARGAGLLDYYA